MREGTSMASNQKIQPINRQRIDWCCAQHDFSVDDLAEKIKVKPEKFTTEALSNDGLTYGQLRNVARVLNRGLLFFMEDGPVIDSQVHSPQFRTLTSQKPEVTPKIKAIIERTEDQRDLLLSLSEDIDTPSLKFDPPKVSKNDIQATATAARKWLRLENESKFEDYRAAVELQGILVFRSNGYAGKWQIPPDSTIAGFSLYHEVCHVIFVRKLEPESRQTFTLMHELGHLLLHKDSFIDSDDDLYSGKGREREANEFAGHLLVPESHLVEIDTQRRPTETGELYAWLKQFRRAWGVSGEVILRRMLDTDRVKKSEYLAYRRYVQNLPALQRSSGGSRYRHREPKHIFGKRFVGTVFDALRTNQITLSKASSYLDNIKISDLQQLEGHLADI